MAFDFPSSPAENQQYTPAGGPTYTYKAPAWRSGVIGIGEAPADGGAYARRNGVWVDTGWRVVSHVAPSVAVAQVDITMPVGWKSARIAGCFRPASVSAYLQMRVSIDNGSTYKAGAADYAYSNSRQQATSVSGTTSTNSNVIFVCSSADGANVNNMPFHCICSNADTTRIFEMFSTSRGYWSGGAGGPTFDTWHAHTAAIGAVTNLRFFASTGNIDVGTDFAVEIL